MASLPPPSPDRNNPRPYRPNDSDADPTKFKRVADTSRPTGGPFGPGSKKKRDQAATKFGGGYSKAPSKFSRDVTPAPRSNFSRDVTPAPRSTFARAGDRPSGPVGPVGPVGPGKPNFGKVGSAHRKSAAALAAPKSSPTFSTPTDWGDVADWYDNLVGDEGSEFHQHVVLPGTLRLLGDVGGKRILDIACGQGVLCRQLVAKGAEMTGVDAAAELLEAARARGPETVTYKLGDATVLEGIEDATFDAATCLLAIQNIQSAYTAFAAAARILKPGGHLVIVMMHPAFRSPKATQWGWQDDVQFRRVDRYLLPRKEPIVMHPGKNDGQYTWTFHRPIGDYVKYLVNAGLLVDRLEEWASHKHSDSGPRAAAENTARKEIPMFLALRAVKPGVASPPAHAIEKLTSSGNEEFGS